MFQPAAIRTVLATITLLGSCMASDVAVAQSAPGLESADPFQGMSGDFNLDAAEARLSLRVPFGRVPSNSDDVRYQPRLQFAIRQNRPDHVSKSRLSAVGSDGSDSHWGITLTRNPRFVLNDRAVVLKPDDTAHLGTPAKIAIGTGAVVVIGVAIVTGNLLANGGDE